MIGKKIAHHLRKSGWKGADGPFDRFLQNLYRRYRNFRVTLKKVENPTYSRLFLKTKNLKRKLTGGTIDFVTLEQAAVWSAAWVQTFPRQYDLIVGVPRSGMLVASIVALKLGKGLTTPDLLMQGEYWHSAQAGEKVALDKINNLLIVDDSVDRGRAMGKAIAAIESIGRDFSITRAALIVRESTKHNVDLYYKTIEPPRAFEWSLMHRKISSHGARGVLAVDLDGVLCANPPKGADGDEEWYVEWIDNANPYLIPGFEIDAIVTCRLEKYRDATERWLDRHKVKYKELHMWGVPDKNERRDDFARFKIDALLRIKPDMYWESDWNIAQKIWEATKVPTLCIDEMTMLS